MASRLHSVWVDPGPTDPPHRVLLDWVLLAAVLVGVVLEAFLHTDLVWRPVAIPVGIALAFTVLWRRSHPLYMLLLVIGVVTVLDFSARIAGDGAVELYSGIFVIVFFYGVFRWGAGREMRFALIAGAVGTLQAAIFNFNGFGELIGGVVFLSIPILLGLAVRYQTLVKTQQVDQVKLTERERLARELHDTVAHHVSAIAIQAQAGQAMAKASSLEGAANALSVIEEEASRTLTEMRSMIGLLRDAEVTADMAPQQGNADIERMAASLAGLGSTQTPSVATYRSGELVGLSPSVDAALFRLAQEAITNSVRHAVDATRIDVHVVGHDDSVHLSVADDGRAATRPARGGYGLIGMTERVALLGGTLTAGPAPSGGWTVDAILPKRVRAT